MDIPGEIDQPYWLLNAMRPGTRRMAHIDAVDLAGLCMRSLVDTYA